MTHTQQEKSPGLLAISALGIVFGDIGTSPLYTFNTVIQLAGDSAHSGSAFHIVLDVDHRHFHQVRVVRHAD